MNNMLINAGLNVALNNNNYSLSCMNQQSKESVKNYMLNLGFLALVLSLI